MESISDRELLERLLAGERYSAQDYRRMAESSGFFSVVVEGLSDHFSASAANAYLDLFSGLISTYFQQASPEELRASYQQMRASRVFRGPEPRHVFVLSRITLGADIAVVSPALDAAKRRFPNAAIHFVGPRKNFEIFAADARITLAETPYGRTSTLASRLECSSALRANLESVSKDWTASIVIDLDSRLTQLGLIPPCPAESYFYFDSRSLEGGGSLSELASGWLAQTFEIEAPQAYIAPSASVAARSICVSLGVGENEAKRVPGSFERQLLQFLCARGTPVLVDEGGSPEEGERVRAAASGLPNVQTFRGSFADFASHIACAELYAGYDSAGQHAAAAAGVPLITIFAGHPNRRFFERWRPTGRGSIKVVDATHTPSLQDIFGQ